MASDLPLVSIGIPVRNGEQHLAEALDSALSQDYPRLEVLVSDNASTDATPDIARQYARADSRVRYWRNPADLGAVGNFGKTQAEARGRYFSWLACDDVLASPSYVSRTTAFLESNPDVAVCGTDIHIRDLLGPGTLVPRRFPEIYPGSCPREARKHFFAWPQRLVCFSVYGMFRREALASVSFAGRTYRGQPVVTHMEYPILVSVLRHGRIVSLSEILRVYRWSPSSSWHREFDRLSGLDALLLGWQTKWFLLRSACDFPLPAWEKGALVVWALRNFFRFSLRTVRGEARRLRGAAEDRRQAILSLRAEIDKRRDLLRQHGCESVDPVAPWPTDLEAVETSDHSTRPGARWRLPAWAEPVRDALEAFLFDFFLPPSPRRRDERRRDLLDTYRLLPVCEDRLRELHHLTTEAERCLALLRSLQPDVTPVPSREVVEADIR